jgi:ferredoxin
VLGDERDSPRGRIVLMKEMLEKGGAPTPETVHHIDRCLSCLSCMTTCPSSVHYMHLVYHARAQIETHFRRPLIDRLMPVVVLATTSHTSEKMISNIEEVRARNGRVIAITTPSQDEVKRLAEFVVEIPATNDALSPLLAVIPLQLLAYNIAVMRVRHPHPTPAPPRTSRPTPHLLLRLARKRASTKGAGAAAAARRRRQQQQ